MLCSWANQQALGQASWLCILTQCVLKEHKEKVIGFCLPGRACGTRGTWATSLMQRCCLLQSNSHLVSWMPVSRALPGQDRKPKCFPAGE